MSYDVFISYTHGADSELAAEIQRGLQRFARPWHRRNALRVFRDATALSANPGLWTSISQVIDQASYLVVLSSPEAAASPWVGREIEEWRHRRPPGRIVPVLTAGTLEWNHALGDFDPAASTALHPALRGAFAEEPLFVDMRWADRGGIVRGDPRFANNIADIAAPIHGVPKDELVGDDLRLHRRTMRLAGAAVVSLSLLTMGTVAGAWIAIDKAEEARRNAEARLELEVDLAGAESDLKETKAKVSDAAATLERTQDDLDSAEDVARRTREAAEQARTERDGYKDESARAKAATATARTASETANAAARRAELDAADAGRRSTEANLAREQALRDQAVALLARNAAVADRERADADKLVAEVGRSTAEAAAQQAEADRAAAETARQQADADRASAETAREQAEADTERAQEAEAEAVLRREQADGAAAATRLAATASADATPVDLSMLLANAATREPNSEGAATLSHGALLSALEATDGVDRFLHFGATEAPRRLAQVAVSPDGKFVAAAETSDRIEVGEEPDSTRVFVWRLDDPLARPRELPRRFDCLSVPSIASGAGHLQWLADGSLLTIENLRDPATPDRCDARVLDVDVNGIAYVARRVLLWNMAAEPPVALDLSEVVGLGTAAYSTVGRLPVEVSKDGRSLWASYDTGILDGSGRAQVLSVVYNTSSRKGDLVYGDPPSLTRDGTFSDSGRYAAVYDYDRGPIVLDLERWVAADQCEGRFAQILDGCYAGVGPALGTTLQRAPTITPDGRSFALARGDGRAVRLFDMATGALRAETPPLPAAIGGFATGNDVVAVVGGDGVPRFRRWTGGGDFVLAPRTVPGNCVLAPGVSRDETKMLLVQHCPLDLEGSLFSESRTTVVVGLASPTDDIREVPGGVVESTEDGKVLVERLDALVVPDSVTDRETWEFGFQLWDFGPDTPASGVLLAAGQNRRAVLSPDSSLLAAFTDHVPGSAPATVDVWFLRERALPSTLPASRGTGSATFAPDGSLVGVGSMGWGVVWRPGASTPDGARSSLATKVFAEDNPYEVCPERGGWSALSPDATTRAVTRDGRSVTVAHLATGTETALPALDLAADERIGAMRFAGTGAGSSLRINLEPAGGCVGRLDGSIIVQLRDGGGPLSPPVARRFAEVGVGSNRDGSRLLFQSPARDALLVRDATTFEIVGQFGTEADLPGAANWYALDPAGDRIVGTNAAGRAVIWSSTGERLAVLEPPSPAERQLLFDAIGAAFSPDGTEVAVKTRDQRLLLWDVEDPAEPELRGTVQLPDDAFARITFAPDGSMLAVDGSYLVDTRRVARVGPRLTPREWDNPQFENSNGSEDSRFLTGPNGELRLLVARSELAVRWTVDVESLRRRSCDLVGRNLTPREVASHGVNDTSGRAPCPGLPPDGR